jgi:predicted nucleotidyltransferase
LRIPITGTIIPNMGTTSRRTQAKPPGSLADALFPSTRQRVLAFLFGQPERSFYATELIGLVAAGSGAVQRELVKLVRGGLVTVTLVGNQKHYQADPACPIFAELCAVAQKTVGLADPLREALAPLAKRIKVAFVFGVVARHRDTAVSDIDVLVLSDRVDREDVVGALQGMEFRLARRINPTVFTMAEWRKKRKEKNAFVLKVLRPPKVFLLGSEADLD